MIKSGIAESSPKNECFANIFITNPANKPATKATSIPPLPNNEVTKTKLPSASNVGPISNKYKITPAIAASRFVLGCLQFSNT